MPHRDGDGDRNEQLLARAPQRAASQRIVARLVGAKKAPPPWEAVWDHGAVGDGMRSLLLASQSMHEYNYELVGLRM